jgi:hypothetical protein
MDTREQHRQRHIELHHALDELFADFIRHAPRRRFAFLDMPVRELMEWSQQQTIEPTGDDESHDGAPRGAA